MDKIDDGGPALPSANSVRVGDMITSGHPGMSLRDRFALEALPVSLSMVLAIDPKWRREPTPIDLAESAYQIADAMLRARGRS